MVVRSHLRSVIVLTAVVSAAACGGSRDQSRPPAPSGAVCGTYVSSPTTDALDAPTGPQAAPPSREPVNVTEAAVDEALTTCAPRYYGGLELRGATLVVHVIDAGRSLARSVVQATLRGRPNALPVSVVHYVAATATIASLSARRDQLTQQADQLRAEGVQLNGWGPDITNNVLLVQVGGSVDAARSKIEAVVGARNLTVVSGGPALRIDG